jgi:hypothetical protein
MKNARAGGCSRCDCDAGVFAEPSNLSSRWSSWTAGNATRSADADDRSRRNRSVRCWRVSPALRGASLTFRFRRLDCLLEARTLPPGPLVNSLPQG